MFSYNPDLILDKKSTDSPNSATEYQKMHKANEERLVLILDTLLIIEWLVICKPVKAITILQLFKIS